MNESFASNKILAPTLHPKILYREGVVRTLIEAITIVPPSQTLPYKLVLLCTPAGYGKTVLLADAVRHASMPCCWYFLDSQDTNPTFLLRGILASIQQCFPAFGTRLDVPFLENNEHISPECCFSFIDTLVNALKVDVVEPFLLALCNYHIVNCSPIINHLVNYFLAHMPEQGTLVIESRVIPALELAPLIARRQMFGLGSEMLCFTSQEVYEMAHLQGLTAVTLERASQIAFAFGGWITGILLGSYLGYSHLYPQAILHSDKGSGSVLYGDHRPLLAYVTKEIFAHEIATYQFLKDISILVTLTPTRCNALLEITDSEQRLNYAEQQGLFLTRVQEQDKRTSVYLCHPILRELFQEELSSQSIERYLALNRRAAHLFLAEQEYEHVVIHALQAGEYQLVASILPEIANDYIARKGTKIVRDWLNLLPKELLSQDPHLLLILADIYNISGEKQQLAQLLDTVEALLHNQSSEDSSTCSVARASLNILRADLSFNEKRFQSTKKLCQEALTLLPTDQRLLRIKALQCLGLDLIFGTGEIPQGIIHLRQALQLSKFLQEEAQVAVLHRQLGTAYSWLSNYTLAEHHHERALFIWQRMDNPRGIVYSLIAMGQLKRRQGFTKEAEEWLTKALYLARTPHQFKSGEAFALEGLGQLAYDQGQYLQALSYLEDSLNIAHTLKDTYLLHCNLCHIATIHTRMDDVPTAQFLLNQVEIEEQEGASYDGVLHCLAQGSILLAQNAYDQAQKTLEHAVSLAQQANIQFLHVTALLHLAFCTLKQGKRRKASQISKHVLEIKRQSDFDHIIQVEVSYFPELQALLDQESTKDNIRIKALQTSQGRFPEGKALVQCKLQSSHLRILAFGEPQVFSDDIPITRWRMARAIELYFFLLEIGHPRSKEQIMAALWADVETEKADQTVRSTIYYLRKAIGEDCLEFSSGLYHLNLARRYEDRIWYDISVFDTAYHEAKEAKKRRDNETASTAFTRMIDLYRGDYLQPFYSNWCIFRRDQLRQAYIDARHQLALIYWHKEDFEASLHHWQHLLALDTCFEKAHHGIMRCYLRQGKRELALKQYQRYCHNLQEELQANPSLNIQKLYQSIQKGNFE